MVFVTDTVYSGKKTIHNIGEEIEKIRRALELFGSGFHKLRVIAQSLDDYREEERRFVENAMKEFAKTAPEKGGDVLAIGGANTAKYTTKSSIIGVKNTIEGKVGSEIEYNSAIGYNNTIENGSNNSVIGTNRKVSGADGEPLIGAAVMGQQGFSYLPKRTNWVDMRILVKTM